MVQPIYLVILNNVVVYFGPDLEYAMKINEQRDAAILLQVIAQPVH